MTDSLIGLLEAAKHGYPNHPRGIGYDEGIDAAIAIIRQHQAEQPQIELIAAMERRRMPEVDAWEKGYNACMDYCVAIIRQREADRLSDEPKTLPPIPKIEGMRQMYKAKKEINTMGAEPATGNGKPREYALGSSAPANPSEIPVAASHYDKARLRIEAAIKQQLELCGYYKSQPNPRLLAYAAIDTIATGGEGQLINRDEAIKQIGRLLRAETPGLENLQSMYNAGVKESANRVAAILPHLHSPKPVSSALNELLKHPWPEQNDFGRGYNHLRDLLMEVIGVKNVD